MKTALISVSHKDGIIEFAQQLNQLGITDIYASGGTYKHLVAGGVEAKDVAGLVGGEAILGHRVVTLSREVHAGLLARHIPEDEAEMTALAIPYVDIACVDFYALEAEIAREGSTLDSVIEKTDIGGPTMVRSAAKGRRVVICDPADRQPVIDWLKAGAPEDGFVEQLAAKAEFVVAQYCMTSATYRSGGGYLGIFGERIATCKYGENAWQTPAYLYSTESDDPLALEKFKNVEGTDPSYNNDCDIERLLQTITHIAAGFDVNAGSVPLIAVIAKHGNPCGVGVGLNAWEKALKGDPLAMFGGFMAVNFTVTKAHLKAAKEFKLSLDGLLAPGFEPEVIKHFARVKGKCRLLVNPAIGSLTKDSLDTAPRFRYVRGGILVQPNYTFVPNLATHVVQYGQLTAQQKRDIVLAWAIGSTSNSNTISIVKEGTLLGNGVGQQDRVGAAILAEDRGVRSDHDLIGAVAYSDSFFPFPDAPEALIEKGIEAIFSSSGSRRDEEVIALCAKHDVTLCMIPDAVGRGFFGH